MTPTDLADESVCRLLGKPRDVPDRKRLLALNGQTMMRILIDRWREKGAQRNGGGVMIVPMRPGAFLEVRARDVDLDFYAELDRALEKLQERDAEAVQVFVRRYWYGQTYEEVGEELGMTVACARGKWKKAKEVLGRIMG
jgi:DNA-directed RNA polymerase specialized sigma24 family protein